MEAGVTELVVPHRRQSHYDRRGPWIKATRENIHNLQRTRGATFKVDTFFMRGTHVDEDTIEPCVIERSAAMNTRHVLSLADGWRLQRLAIRGLFSGRDVMLRMMSFALLNALLSLMSFDVVAADGSEGISHSRPIYATFRRHHYHPLLTFEGGHAAVRHGD